MVIPSSSVQSTKFLSNRSKGVILQSLDTNALPPPQTRSFYPTYTTIYSEPRPSGEGEEDVFVETFLIDAVSSVNKKGWRVSYDNPEDFDRRVQESRNHPLVLFQTKGSRGELIYDHPVAPITSLEAAADPVRANIEFQKKYTVGNAVSFKKVKNGIWNAVYKITNKQAKKFFLAAKKKGITLFTSPYIVRPADEPDRQNIHEWALIHNAIVSQPATNDRQIASVKDVVLGDTPNLSSLFASLTTEDDPEPGFSMEKALEDYIFVTSHDSSDSQNKDMVESASENATNQQVQTTLLPQITQQQQQQQQLPQPIENQTYTYQNGQWIPVEQQQQQQQQPPTNKEEPSTKEEDTTTVNNETKTLQKQILALQKQNEELQAKYAYDTRYGQVERILAPIIKDVYTDAKTGEINEKEYKADVTKWTKGAYTLDEVQELAEARFMRANWPKLQAQAAKGGERASVTSQVDETASFPYTAMKTETTNNTNTTNETLGISVIRRMYTGGAFY